MTPSSEPNEILLVEDDPGDTLMIREILAGNGSSNHLTCLTDGEQAIEFLHRRGAYADAPRPDLVLLDLNLPRRHGREVLAEIKQSPELGVIPVIILTTSQSADDMLRSYELHANAYIVKPADFEAFAGVVREINRFFASTVSLPRGAGR
jgi:CheY-like chemotaxis protein